MVDIKYMFPAIMIALNMSQCIVMLVRKDCISAIYWASAAMLNLTVAIKQ